MPALEDYVDVRDFLPGFERRVCPDCGGSHYFQHHTTGHGDYWRCLNCRKRYEHVIEVVCPACDTRMVTDDDHWRCRRCGDTREFDRGGLIAEMTGHYAAAGHDCGRWTTCPVCHAGRSVMCDPDGARFCDECGDFYAGRFSDEWFAYATYVSRKKGWGDGVQDWIRVNA